jgi:hypothetical protein
LPRTCFIIHKKRPPTWLFRNRKTTRRRDASR